MLFLNLLEIVFAFGLFLFVTTQLLFPIVMGRPLFPMFTWRKDHAKKMMDLNEKVDMTEAEMEAAEIENFVDSLRKKEK